MSNSIQVPTKNPTEKLSIPEGLDCVESASLTTIRRVWISWKVAPLILFAIGWDSFLIFWYSTALKSHPPLMAVLFPLGHVAVGIGLTYFIIASLFNKTDIECNALGVRVQTYPIPWMGNCAVRAEDIKGVVLRQRTGNQNNVSYTVMYIDASRKERKLVRGLTEYEQAAFIAQVIKSTLGLADEESA